MTYSVQKQNYLNKCYSFDFYSNNLSAELIKNIFREWIPYANQIREEALYLNILKLFDDANYSYN